jgi:hypothetical protein
MMVFATNHQPQVLPPYFATRKKNPEAEYAGVKAELEELRNTAMNRIDTYNCRYDLAFCYIYGMPETF